MKTNKCKAIVVAIMLLSTAMISAMVESEATSHRQSDRLEESVEMKKKFEIPVLEIMRRRGYPTFAKCLEAFVEERSNVTGLVFDPTDISAFFVKLSTFWVRDRIGRAILNIDESLKLVLTLEGERCRVALRGADLMLSQSGKNTIHNRRLRMILISPRFFELPKMQPLAIDDFQDPSPFSVSCELETNESETVFEQVLPNMTPSSLKALIDGFCAGSSQEECIELCSGFLTSSPE